MGALDGVKVIDLTRVLGGPFCTQWLGDHGADVIKIEPPQGDETRHWGPPFEEQTGAASYFIGVNRNKRGMALDLRQQAGRDVLLRLLADADILIENFKPGGMEKWGLGFETLKEQFPRLIHCRISGFGADGPYGGLPGYDAVVQAQSGLMSVNGEAGGDGLRLGIPLVDIGTGLSALAGLGMALYEREKSGQGQFLDMTLQDVAVSLLHPHAANYFLSGKVPAPTGNAHPNITPYDVFPTKGAKIYIAAANDGQFARLCNVIGAQELLSDPRFADHPARNRHKAEIAEALAPFLSDWDGQALAEALMAKAVPAGPVLNVADVTADAHQHHRAMVVEAEGVKTLGNPIKMSRTPADPTRARPPAFGQDTSAILTEAGYSAEEIAALREAGAALGD
ncbi:CaiB/BaiF CoA transferase family protein [Pontivivens insulae]|uniref:Acetyl-CoA:oxalate CoA-transferase n=1 Tax=Pontivivens insulae TaxID=1639689 RepID=A0A2R8AB23_9RHOB|nr:CoA transferase [Pontivivens insulae]RED11396.1 formyl-CoA transferase [Pontivivens insulae]SPF29431.1 Acetyl-CoA:oxalate CoA-transferase [Pontivivens insulae]